MPNKSDYYHLAALSYVAPGTPTEVFYQGLASEVGEVLAERVKELRPDREDIDNTEAVLDELSDVLWYVTVLAWTRGASLESLMGRNLVKLQERQLKGKK